MFGEDGAVREAVQGAPIGIENARLAAEAQMGDDLPAFPVHRILPGNVKPGTVPRFAPDLALHDGLERSLQAVLEEDGIRAPAILGLEWSAGDKGRPALEPVKKPAHAVFI